MKINRGKLCLCCLLTAVTIMPGCAKSGGSVNGKTETQAATEVKKTELDKYKLEAVDLETDKKIGNDILKEKDINLLIIWQPTCQPCKLEAEVVESLHKEYEDVSFIGLGVADTKNEITKAITDWGVTYKNYQLTPKFLKSYEDKIKSTPTLLILNSEGEEIIAKKVGTGDGSDKEKIREELKAVIEEAKKNAK